MFTPSDRTRVRDRLVEMAHADDHVVGAAQIGSLAFGDGDRWSDIDLMLSVGNGIPVAEVLADWTTALASELDATVLFDLPSGPIVYRVFILPSLLEIDLSAVPTAEFAPSGDRVRIFFGERGRARREEPTRAEDVLGYAVHHALHARVAIERERPWQAEYWIGEVRDRALILECEKRGLDGWYGRDFDRLPSVITEAAAAALVPSLSRDDLLRALRAAVGCLRVAASDVQPMWGGVEAQLHEIVDPALASEPSASSVERSAT